MKIRNFIIIFLAFFSQSLNGQGKAYKNLALEGGGITGIAYFGALQILDSAGYLKGLDNIAGTSAGALQALMISLGYSSKEMIDILSELKFEHFNDGGGMFVGGGMRLGKFYGYYRGMAVNEWAEDIIVRKTGIHNLTFSQMDSLIQTDSNYSNLYIVASNITYQRPEVLCVQTYPQMKISDAVQASSAIPFYYEPVVINQHGHRLERGESDSAGMFLVDGGLLANFPYFVYDSLPGTTLGLMLDRPEQVHRSKMGVAPFRIKSLNDYVEACYNAVFEMQTARIWSENIEKNTIRINVGDTGPRIKKMKKSEVEALTQSGRNASRSFINKK